MSDNPNELLERLAALEEENRKLRRLLTKGRKNHRPSRNGHNSGRIYGYARASTGKQEISVLMQEDIIRNRAAKLQGQLVKTFTDPATSGRDVRWEDRNGFRALIDVLTPGDHLIIWRLDRIERNPFAMLEALRFLVDAGVSVHVLEYGEMQLDLDKPMGRLLVMLLAGFAGFFIDQLSEANRQVWHWLHDRGLAAGPVEMGKRRTYKMVPDLQKSGQMKQQGYDDWDPADSDIIREIWRRHEVQHESLCSIAKELERRGASRADGRAWAYRRTYVQPGRKTFHDISDRGVSKAYWRYTAMLAVGQDLQGLPAKPEHMEIARERIREHRKGWMSGVRWAPAAIRECLARGDYEGALAVKLESNSSSGCKQYPAVQEGI